MICSPSWELLVLPLPYLAGATFALGRCFLMTVMVGWNFYLDGVRWLVGRWHIPLLTSSLGSSAHGV